MAGSWKNWDRSAPSVWLSAWCVRVLHAVSFQDWEDYIYIDPEVFGHAVMWLLNFQNSEGAFVEASDVDTPLHYAMRSSMYSSNYSAHAALTAHVLIAMDDAAPLLTGHIKVAIPSNFLNGYPFHCSNTAVQGDKEQLNSWRDKFSGFLIPMRWQLLPMPLPKVDLQKQIWQ